MSDKKEELATGGVIENAPLMGSETGCEYLVRDEPLQHKGWLDVRLMKFTPEQEREIAKSIQRAMDNVPVGRLVPEPRTEFIPSNTFPTEESLRDFVKRCVDEHLDELARAFNEHPGVQPGTWRKEE